MDRYVMVMAKAPFPGEVKTRLASSVGDEPACALHQAFLLDTLSNIASLGDLGIGIVCPDSRHGDALRSLVPDQVSVFEQERPGLMAGISAAFQCAQTAGAQAVLVTEADSPSLPAAHFERCFEALGTARSLVLGPCDDGGYYLVGGRGLDEVTARSLFEGERYDSSTICRRTGERARELGLEVAFGPSWFDVDTLDELLLLSDQADEKLAHTAPLLRQWARR